MLLPCLEKSELENLRPPRGFIPVRGSPRVKIIDEPSFINTKGNAAQASVRKGLRYQDQIMKYLETTLDEDWVGFPGLWFEFTAGHKSRTAQADWVGLNMREYRICIVEVKLSRVAKAWWQLNKLYKPLVAQLFPGWDISLLEIASKLQTVVVPERVRVVSSLESARPGETSFMKVEYAARRKNS